MLLLSHLTRAKYDQCYVLSTFGNASPTNRFSAQIAARGTESSAAKSVAGSDARREDRKRLTGSAQLAELKRHFRHISDNSAFLRLVTTPVEKAADSLFCFSSVAAPGIGAVAEKRSGMAEAAALSASCLERGASRDLGLCTPLRILLSPEEIRHAPRPFTCACSSGYTLQSVRPRSISLPDPAD